MLIFLLKISITIYYLGFDLLCGFTGTVLGPGFGEFGFFLGVGEGFDLLCGFTGTVLAMILKLKIST